MSLDILEYLKEFNRVIIPIATFVLGFLVSRFTLSKKEKLDHAQQLYENSRALMKDGNECFQEFTAALERYANKLGKPSFEDFYRLSTVGEKYFFHLKLTADAILSNKVDAESRDQTLVPRVKEAVEKSLPAFYSTLQSIAEKREIEYKGELKRENYKSIYAVAEKYT